MYSMINNFTSDVDFLETADAYQMKVGVPITLYCTKLSKSDKLFLSYCRQKMSKKGEHLRSMIPQLTGEGAEDAVKNPLPISPITNEF